MPHTNSVLVMHPNGSTYTQRPRAQSLVDNKRAYWRDSTKTVLIIVPAEEPQRNDNYEYVGKHSMDKYATRRFRDKRTGVDIEVPKEFIDRTQIPVREAGGQKVMQLAPKSDRRGAGRATHFRDSLWRPGRRAQCA